MLGSRHGHQPKHPLGAPMTLANTREQGVHHLIAYCSTIRAVIWPYKRLDRLEGRDG